MARFYEKLTSDLIDFIRAQPIFFVASAAGTGRVNLSPKGMDTFRVLADDRVAYLDLTGSGNETAGHLLHDGRITIMCCSFTEKPLILRLYGRGQLIRPQDADWNDLIPQFPPIPGTRQIIAAKIETLQTSCGFGVPRLDLVEERQMLRQWCEKKGPEALKQYRQDENRKTIDGLDTGVF
jgi:hypothetical protein